MTGSSLRMAGRFQKRPGSDNDGVKSVRTARWRISIAAVVDHFSDAVVQNPIVGQRSENPALREWHTNNLGRLPGLKFMRTLWVCNVAGGPFQYAATKPGSTPIGLEVAHRELKISPAQFDEVAAELGRTLDFFKVPEREKEKVLAAFAAHKGEVTEGYSL